VYYGLGGVAAHFDVQDPLWPFMDTVLVVMQVLGVVAAGGVGIYFWRRLDGWGRVARRLALGVCVLFWLLGPVWWAFGVGDSDYQLISRGVVNGYLPPTLKLPDSASELRMVGNAWLFPVVYLKFKAEPGDAEAYVEKALAYVPLLPDQVFVEWKPSTVLRKRWWAAHDEVPSYQRNDGQHGLFIQLDKQTSTIYMEMHVCW
jgi:hypothetical protein